MDSYPTLLVSALLLLLNVLLSLGGESTKNLNKPLLARKAEEGNGTAKKILETLEKPGYTFRAALRTGRSLCKILAAALVLQAFHAPLTAALAALPFPSVFASAILILSVLIVFLLFAELFAIRAAEQKADEILLSTWGLLRLFTAILYPIAIPVNALASLLLKIFGFKQQAEDALSREEIQNIVEESGESGLLEEQERDMLEGILDFNEKTAAEVMTPRTEVFLVDGNVPLTEQMDAILNEKYSRIPVFREEIDNIVGILYLKDFFCEAYRVGFENVNVEACMREVYFVPEKKPLDALYRDLQESKNHMAVLIDEYGGFSGIVTIEDLIEEVMGDIDDEYDESEEEIRTEDDGTFMADGSASVAEINEILGSELDEDDGDYDTVGGLIIKLLGYIPEEGETPYVEHEGFSFRVETIADRRIGTVRIVRLPEDETAEEKED